MAKLPSKKTKPGASLAVSKVKKGPKKTLKKNSTKNIASTASPKPTKATNSTKNNASPASSKPTKGGLAVSKAKKSPKKALKKKNTQNNSSPASPKPTKVTNSTKNNASPASPKPSKATNTKPKATQMEKKNKKAYNPAKSQKKKRGRKAKSGSFPAKRNIILKRTRKPERVVDEAMMKKFSGQVKAVVKGKKKRPEVVDPEELISLDMLEAAVGGLRKLPATGKNEKKSLHDITDEDERFVYLQVTLCKLPRVTEDFHLYGPTTVSVYLPHSLVTDNTDVILITKDLQRGVKRDHTNSLDHFKERLHAHGATALVNEVIPLRQLKVEYKEYEAKRLLANRADVLLCDDTIMRFIPKFLSKHFYTKKKLPVQVNLKAKDLQKEVLRALAVSKLFFSMKGNSALMKVGRLSQTDEELRENVLAAVKKVATQAPGHWANVQGLGLKLQETQSIPLYVNMESLNSVEPLPVKPLYPGEAVSGTLSTQPGKCITVFPDGTVTSMNIGRRTRPRLAKEAENIKNKTEETETKRGKKSKKEKKLAIVDNKEELPEAEEDSKKEAKKSSSKRKGDKEKKSNKTKKQKKTHGSDSDSDSGEEDLEEQEMTYLRQLTQRKEEESGGAQKEKEEEEGDVWGSESEMGESD